MNESVVVERLIEQFAQVSCAELFEAYGVPLVTMHEDVPDVLGDDVVLTGIVGFTGPGILGMCLIASSDGPLAASNPAAGSLRDWMAELTNQLVGRLKHKLIARGAVVYITTPIVMQGARIEPCSRRGLMRHRFTSASGSLSLWVDVELSTEFALSDVCSESALSEGEAILF